MLLSARYALLHHAEWCPGDFQCDPFRNRNKK